MGEMFKEKKPSLKDLYDDEKVKEIERLKAENEELKKQVGSTGTVTDEEEFLKGFRNALHGK